MNVKQQNNLCLQLQSEHEWIVRKLDSECAKVSHVEELYEEAERLHKKLDVQRVNVILKIMLFLIH